MSFASKSRPFADARSRARRGPPVSAAGLGRIVVFGALVAGAAGWAVARHRSRDLPPLRIPVPPSPAASYDVDAGEVPVPDMIEMGDD
jgi:hypothetical protein